MRRSMCLIVLTYAAHKLQTEVAQAHKICSWHARQSVEFSTLFTASCNEQSLQLPTSADPHACRQHGHESAVLCAIVCPQRHALVALGGRLGLVLRLEHEAGRCWTQQHLRDTYLRAGASRVVSEGGITC